jgi:DNA-binding NarL/FixJ family response regulator
MLGDIVQALTAEQSGLQVVGRLGRGADLVAAVEDYRADVVVTRAGAAEPDTLARLLFARPRLRLLVLSQDGREAYVHTLVPNRVVLHDVSPHEILDALRGTGRFRSSSS